MKTLIAVLASILSLTLGAQAKPAQKAATICEGQIARALEKLYKSHPNMGMFDHAGPTEILAHKKNTVIQKAILSADRGYAMYEVATRVPTCQVMMITFIYSD